MKEDIVRDLAKVLGLSEDIYSESHDKFTDNVLLCAVFEIKRLKDENAELRQQKAENYGNTHALLESLKGGGMGAKVDSRESDHWKRYWKMYYEETVNDLMAQKESFERAYTNLYEKCKQIGVVKIV